MRPPVTASKSDGTATLPCKAQYNNKKEVLLTDSNQRILSTTKHQQDTSQQAYHAAAANTAVAGVGISTTTMDRIQNNSNALLNQLIQNDRLLGSSRGSGRNDDADLVGISSDNNSFGNLSTRMNQVVLPKLKPPPITAIEAINHSSNHIGNTTNTSLVPGLNNNNGNSGSSSSSTSSGTISSGSSLNRIAASDIQKKIFLNQTYDPALIVLPLSETEPLLRKFEDSFPDSKHTICLNKNSNKLIFVKKDAAGTAACGGGGGGNGSVVGNEEEGDNSDDDNDDNIDSYIQSNSLFSHKRSQSANFSAANRRLLESARYSNSGRVALQHRRSLQLNYPGKESAKNSSSVLSTLDNRKQHSHSWYEPIYTALKEEFESDSRELSPVHSGVTRTYQNCDIENAASNNTDDDILMRSQIDNPSSSPPPSQKRSSDRPSFLIDQQQRKNNPDTGQMKQKHHIQNYSETGNGGGGRRPRAASSSDATQMPKRKRLEVFLKSLIGRKPFKDVNPNPLLASPEIRITHSPSEHSLLRSNTDGTTQSATTVPDRTSGLGADSAGCGQINESTSSLNIVQQKLWNVVPLLKGQDSSTSLRQENKVNTIVQYSGGMRKCETVLALSPSNYLEPIKPLNRLRSCSSISNANCSRCSSFLSLAASGSRYSLNAANRGFVTVTVTNLSANENAANLSASDGDATFLCKLCLAEVSTMAGTIIENCGCIFCTECMTAYIEFEILEGAYEISCPDSQCPSQGILSVKEIKSMVSSSSSQKFDRYRLNREIELDKNRTWCPRAGCETICLIDSNPSSTSSAFEEKFVSLAQVNCPVRCPTCHEEFCSGCKKALHSNVTCEENARRLVAEGLDNSIGIPFDNDLIKSCPMCAVPIEKDEGCAQMMCKRCKHVFCWYCLASLDDDFLLRHYDKGPCKNKLGHSRASVVWHRAQVIGIFAGFGILLLVASPLLLLAAPCIICCKCRMCSGSKKLDDIDTDFDDTANTTTQR